MEDATPTTTIFYDHLLFDYSKRIKPARKRGQTKPHSPYLSPIPFPFPFPIPISVLASLLGCCWELHEPHDLLPANKQIQIQRKHNSKFTKSLAPFPKTERTQRDERCEKGEEKQATRDAEQTRRRGRTTTLATQNSISKTCSLKREKDPYKTLEPTLVRHSLCKQTLNAPTKPTIVSAHCAIVTKPTSRDLGLCKKLALKVEPHVSISPEMESHILAMG